MLRSPPLFAPATRPDSAEEAVAAWYGGCVGGGSHVSLTAAQLAQDNLVRFSCGIEDYEDIESDVLASLDAL